MELECDFYVRQKVSIKNWDLLVSEYGTRFGYDGRSICIDLTPVFSQYMKPYCGKSGTITRIFNHCVRIKLEDTGEELKYYFPFEAIIPGDDIEYYAVDDEDFTRFLMG